MSREQIVQLDKGGVVAFQEYGDPSGVPVIFCHGWPSSRTMAQLADEPARALGVRIISPDRPGISGSSMQLDRKLSDWPRVVEQLVDNLEIGEFRILAISGGAPYAYATAVAIPERVRAIAVVGGVIPFAELKDFNGLLPLYRYMLAFYRNRPRLLRPLFFLARPFLSFRAPIPLRPLLLKMLLLRLCDSGMEEKIALSPFGWRKQSRTVSRIAKRDSFKTKDITHCRSATCARFLRIWFQSNRKFHSREN